MWLDFLQEFVVFTRCFKVNILPISGDNFTTTTIYWTGTPATLTPSTPTTAFTASAGANPLTVAIVSAKLKQLGQYTFTATRRPGMVEMVETVWSGSWNE